jgi:hypothetical protein
VPHGRRSDLINVRDLEVLEFIARFGVVPREAVASWSRAGRSVSYERERRLRLAGLLVVEPGPRPGERLLSATRQGLRACGRPDLAPVRRSPATLRHDALASCLAARLEAAGERLLSEREIGAAERAAAARIYSAELADGRPHRADLIRLGPTGAEAIEVELTTKGAARLDALLRAWRLAVAERRLCGVVYHCAPRTRRLVEAAIERTATGRMVGAVDVEL